MTGVFDNESRARQLIRFDGMNIGKLCFTDFDAVMEYRNKAWLVFEVKHGDKAVPIGQRLALERFVDDVEAKGKHAVAAVVEHCVGDYRQDIYLRDCIVRNVYVSRERAWRPPTHRMTAKGMLESYIKWICDQDARLNV